MKYIGIDIGGTNLKTGLVDAAGCTAHALRLMPATMTSAKAPSR